MTLHGKVVAFVPSLDLDGAEDFYVGSLGLVCLDRSPYALVLDGGTSEIRVTFVEDKPSAPFTVLGWQVTDLDAVVDRLRARSVAFKDYGGMEQDDHHAWTAPDGSRIVWFTDPDDNVLSLQEAPS